MPWIKLDTGFYRHPKTAEILTRPKGAEAIIALQEMWCWAAESESPDARSGHVSDAIAKKLGVKTSTAKTLEAAGFLHRNGNGWVIHDWTQHQGSLLEKRLRDRENAKARRRKETTNDTE